MIRTIFQIGLVLLALTALSGCLGDSDSDEYGEDIEEFEAPAPSDTYRARVLNGELENAFVWLDMDGDGKLSTYGEADYKADFEDPEAEEGDLIVPERLSKPQPEAIPEPWAITDAHGNVILDVSAFDLRRTQAPDLDPDEFPLMAIGVPGVSRNDGVTIEKAFFLRAPPGITNVTPFSTMAETLRRVQMDRGNEADSASAGTALLQEEILGSRERVGPYQDYLRSQGQTAVPFYATAIRRLIQAQVPEGISSAISDKLRNLEPQSPPQTYFDPRDMRVIGSLLLDQAASVIQEVGEDIGDDIPDGYTLPAKGELDSITDFDPDLSNPYVAVEQRYFIPGDASADFQPGAAATNGRLSAQIFLDYGLGARLRRMGVRGRAQPSMGILPFLVKAEGRPADLGFMPWLDIDTSVLAGDPLERDAIAESDLDEQFIGQQGGPVDWETRRVGLDSSWFGTEGNETEVDGKLERVYKVPASGTRDLIRANAVNPGARDAQVTIESQSEAGKSPVNLWLSDDGVSNSELRIDYGPISGLSDCGPTIQHVNAKQAITLNRGGGDSVTITRYGHHRADPGDGETAFRVMVETYDNPSGESFRREYDYFSDGIGTESEMEDSLKKTDQPDLLRSIRVLRSDVEISASTFCNGDNEPFSVEASPDDMRLYVGFKYRRFADYLESVGTQD